jgi:hypothetical protein
LWWNAEREMFPCDEPECDLCLEENSAIASLKKVLEESFDVEYDLQAERSTPAKNVVKSVLEAARKK